MKRIPHAVLVVCLSGLLLACNGTPTATPTVTVTPRTTAERVCALETKVTHLEWQVGTLLVILKEFEEVE